MRDKAFPFGPTVTTIYRFLKVLNAGISRQEIRDVLREHRKQSPISLLTVSHVLQSLGLTTYAFQTSIEHFPKIDPPLIAFYPRRGKRRLILIEHLDSISVTYYVYNEGLVKESLLSFSEAWNGVILSGQIKELRKGSIREEEENKIIFDYKQKDIKLVSGFLTEQECDELIDYAEKADLFKHSLVNDNSKLKVSKARTSYSAFLPDRNNPVLDNIYNKASAFLNTGKSHIEDLQIVRYSEEQEFKPHFDPKEKSDRKYTMLIYLNDDFEGGETYFPELDLKIQPKKGNLLYFLNRNEENEIISFSIHAGLPIHKGTKYGCNIWVGNPHEQAVS